MIYIDFKNIDIMGVADTGGSGGTDLSNYYTKSETDTKLAAKANKNEIPDISILATKTELSGKVDKVSGKGLSTNDYTTSEKNKLAGLSNYDDTSIKQQITNIENSIGGINTMLDSINGEII
jgi:hypothetical protein